MRESYIMTHEQMCEMRFLLLMNNFDSKNGQRSSMEEYQPRGLAQERWRQGDRNAPLTFFALKVGVCCEFMWLHIEISMN